MRDLAYNKRGVFDYDLIEKYEAGVALIGAEVKSVRKGNVSLKGAFVTIKGGEMWLTNATIPPWQPANAPSDYDPTRPRKLLLKKTEIKRLIGAKESHGLTIVPIRLYNKRSLIKLEMALARGKKQYQKKEQKREHDIKREVERMLRGKE